MMTLKSNSRLGKQKVLIVVLDGVGENQPDESVSRYVGEDILPGQSYQRGNAVNASYMPNLDSLRQLHTFRTIRAHGKSVGLPSDDDMGNSEVGHNAMGAGRVFDQGAKLVNFAISSGALFKDVGWTATVKRADLVSGKNTLHFCGLLSDGNVHSHIQHLFSLIEQAKKDGIKKVRIHALLDGRDVPPTSALDYVSSLEQKLAELYSPDFDVQVASGGGRMQVTMDRYNSDWRIVEKGYKAHVLGESIHQFSTLNEAVLKLRVLGKFNDQDLPPFVIAKNQLPVGPVIDGDSFIFFNFRGDRAIEISRALTEEKFTEFARSRFPKVHYAGMMQYDGDLKIPSVYLVTPPVIENTMTEILSLSGVKQFACSETQKYGHVTYFWNGNRSGKFVDAMENYVEVPSDLVPFEERPWMKAAEIADATIREMRNDSFNVGRINFANGDMVGHTGSFAAATCALGAVDLALGRIMQAALETNTVLLVTADHGNADEMFELDKKTGKVSYDANGKPKIKTSHTLSPVPFSIFNGEAVNEPFHLRDDLPHAGLANIAATAIELAGYDAPQHFDPSLIKFGNGKKTKKNKSKNEALEISQSAAQFFKTVAMLRAPNGCPWDKEQTFSSLRPYMIEEAYEAVAAADKLTTDKNESSHFCDELGDVLLQVFLNSQIASEEKLFTVADVFKAIDRKMVSRHPHVFSKEDSPVKTSDDVVDQWEKIKEIENASKPQASTLLKKSLKKRDLPTLTFGTAVSKSAKKLGFAWPSIEEVFKDLKNEVDELAEELFSPQFNQEKIEDEMGDVIYTLCNIVTHFNIQGKEIDLDLAARGAIEKFITRFKEMEQICAENGSELSEDRAKTLTLDEWNDLWKKAKLRRYK